jgi:Ca2+-dependent lipid-binding protein
MSTQSSNTLRRTSNSSSNLLVKEKNAEVEIPLWLQFKVLPPVIYGSLVLGFLVAYFGFSLFWCLLYAIVIRSFVYNEINRLKKSVVFQAQRESAGQLLSYHSETVEWLNFILERIWIVYTPVLSEDLGRSIDLILEGACPSFLESLRLKVFSLGAMPPVFSNAVVHPSLEKDLISLDLDIAFEPIYENNESTNSQGLKIELVAKLMKIDLPIRLTDLYFSSKVI